MRAVIQTVYGTAPTNVLQLAETTRPTIGDDQVLVRVVASSVDQGTWHIMAGRPYAMRAAGFGIRTPKALNPGRNLAGTIEAVGANVTDLHPGDEVFGTGEATFAEYARAKPATLAPKPANLSFEEAAAVPVSALAALQAVRRAGVGAGTSVLIIGASGGVGTFAVQIARAFGATVTGVATTAKVELVRSLGADQVIDYARSDFVDGTRYDAVLDIGGNNRVSRLRRAIAPRGRLVIVGGEADARWLGMGRQLRAHLLSLFVRQTLGTFISSENATDLNELRELIEADKLMPAIERSYPLGETAAAIEHLRAGRARGKLAITIAGANHER
ncbi:MAG: NAD(P)-dependent alcohol dehydrogenase [Actinobacteria bacterium]|nr:NAD(P)-dependent alcohol dehydrogenase [Actinomycetota bacterium]